MNLAQFHRLRTAVQVSAPPGAGTDLVAVETDLRDALLDSGLFVTVEVGRTEDPDALVIALCTYDPFFSEGDIASRLEEFWSERVRYPFWEAHGLLAEPDHVELKAASRVGPQGHYVTVHLVAQRSLVPAQRRPSD